MTPASSAPSLQAWFERYGVYAGLFVGITVLAFAADLVSPA